MTVSDDQVGGRPLDRVPAGTAAGLAAAEGLGFLALAVGQLVLGDARGPGFAVAAFFAVCAAGLLWCAAGVVRRQSWSRGPLVAAQLLLLAIAWSYRQPYPGWAAALAVTAAACLGLLLAPATGRRVNARPEPGRGPA